DLAMTGRAALIRAAAIGILDLAVSFLARAADDALADRGEPDGDVGHDPIELEENIAPQIDVARVFRSEMNRDDQRLAQVSERALIGGGKGVTPVLGEIDRSSDLRGQGDDRASNGHADDRPNELGAPWHAGMQPHRRKRGEAAERSDEAQHDPWRWKSLPEAAQRRRQRQARYPLEHAGLAGERKVEHPGADREGEGDDRRGRRAFGNARRE